MSKYIVITDIADYTDIWAYSAEHAVKIVQRLSWGRANICSVQKAN